MNFRAKKLLLILELNETLLYLRNERSKIKDFATDQLNIKYDDKVGNYSVLFRQGRFELLDYLFLVDKDKIDVAVWSNFDQNLTQSVCQKYFGRYFRDLLFVMATNRALYSNAMTEPQHSLQIPRDLNTVYKNFPGYSSTNTLILNAEPNTLTEHMKNDVIFPRFSPKSPDFMQDVGCFAINKYLRGVVSGLSDNRYKDVRDINFGKPLEQLFKRLKHRTFTNSDYR